MVIAAVTDAIHTGYSKSPRKSEQYKYKAIEWLYGRSDSALSVGDCLTMCRIDPLAFYERLDRILSREFLAAMSLKGRPSE